MKTSRLLPTGALLLLSLIPNAIAHGSGHDQVPLAADATWAERHMAEEHHIGSFDAGVFFHLHDYDGTGFWSGEDVRRTYGLMDESTNHISDEQKASVERTVMDLYDTDKDGRISRSEFLAKNPSGQRVNMPDFGLGPGHHGDDEYEYEIHHFEKYHGDDAKEEDLTHPEDIEHFRKHEQMEAEQEAWERRERMGIVEANIPAKFRRGA